MAKSKPKASPSPGASVTGNGSAPDRLTEPVGDEAQPRLDFPVVGLGASAGGLEAFCEFLDAMPAASGLAFVLIQHLPPDRESLLVEILARHTAMRVSQVEDGIRVEPNHVYVIRPGYTLTIRDGLLRLGAAIETPGHRRPVDDFFRSLAEEQRERAIAVVMSGTGSNGSAGAQSIKAVGGVCIAQDPESANFPSMPRKLLDLHLADFVLRPAEMPEVLLRYSAHPYARGATTAEMESMQDRNALRNILTVLRTRLRHDFTGYKKPTVLRRVQRRMGLNQLTSIAEYARLLRQNPTEVSALADDLMIHVTGFFRDPEIWEALRTQVVQPLVAERADDGAIRAWVTACSSGEEAYTLAIVLLEELEAAGKRTDVKIFATDTAERSLGYARNGIYPAGIESELTAERLERYFERKDAVYRVKRQLREVVVFAPQNLLQDPPFSRVDICTCRNLLIYLEPEVQRRALALMHFGLREQGVLLLGSSETVMGAEELFEPIDKKARLYRRIGRTRHGTVDFPLPHALVRTIESEASGGSPPQHLTVAQLTESMLLNRFSPAAVAIDREQRIVYFHGPTAQYLDQPRGEPTRDLLTLVREPLRGAVRAALSQAMGENTAAVVRAGLTEASSGHFRTEIVVAPLEAQPAASHYLVTFQERPEPVLPADPAAKGDVDRRRLHEELRRVRDELQSTIEELQTSNEEMKASNEEATSVNEELQSANEELETSKEELQSLNEELTTVNAQLQAKMQELEATTNDLSSLLSSTSIAVLFLDTHFRIRRFTPAVKDLVELIPSDIGRPLSDLAPKFSDEHLMADAQSVLEKLVPIEREIGSESQRVYVRRILPYRTADNRIDGVVVTFFDVSARKRAESALTDSDERHRLIIEGVHEYAIFMLDRDGRIATWNPGAERVLGYAPPEAIGQHFEIILPLAERERGMAADEMRRAQEQGSVIEDGWHQRKDGIRFWGSGTLSALKDGAGELRGFVKLLRDNTELRLHEETLANAKAAAEAANVAKDQFLANVSHELRTPLSSIVLWSSLLQEGVDNPQQSGEALQSIRNSAEELRELIEDLVDTSRIVTGNLRLDRREVPLLPLVRSCVESLRPSAQQKNLVIEQDLDPAAAVVRADPGRMQQVVSNLVANSIKFTPAGGTIRVRLRREGDEIELRVTDSGQGITADFLPHVFDRFGQAEPSSRRADSGLGLGLAISKQIVEMHGGTITAQSDGPGHGSEFSVRLPLPAVREPVAPETNGATRTAADVLAGRRVLLVEDSAGTRRALSVAISLAGATVVAVASAGDALAELHHQRPDLIVSDIGLPLIDGFALLAQIREAEASQGLPPVPAVALTAYAGQETMRRALQHGYQRCLTKPVEPSDVVAALAAMKD